MAGGRISGVGEEGDRKRRWSEGSRAARGERTWDEEISLAAVGGQHWDWGSHLSQTLQVLGSLGLRPIFSLKPKARSRRRFRSRGDTIPEASGHWCKQGPEDQVLHISGSLILHLTRPT